MNLFNVISAALIGGPTAYTAVIALRHASVTLLERWLSRHEFHRLPAEGWAVEAREDRRHAVVLALTSIPLVAGMVAGMVVAYRSEAWFWVGAIGAALCVITYWVALRPRQTAIARRQGLSST